MRHLLLSAALVLCIGTAANADEGKAGSPARTRPEMKRRIEALKEREARLPLPALTPEEIAAGRRSVNNGRLRSLYLPETWTSGTFRPAGSGARNAPGGDRPRFDQGPDYGFKTRLFWIVSRTNDCQYCLGHQELKLRRVGMSDDEIASLDSKWSVFPQQEQAAMDLTRKMTISPHTLTPADIKPLKAYYTDAQIVDLVQTVAGYNSTNRWTASTGIPQDRSFGGDEPSQLDTPTSAEFAAVQSRVAPFDHQPRPAWESRSQVEEAIAACLGREPLVPLPSVESARTALNADTPGSTPPVWFQAMSFNPQSAVRAWRLRQAIVRDGKLNPILKAQIAWTSSRENRAWYAAAHARARLNALGVSDDAIHTLADDQGAPSEKAAIAFARKLTAAPHTVTDADVAGLRKLFSDHEVAEIIFLVCEANSFDRFTETLRLPLEAGLSITISAK